MPTMRITKCKNGFYVAEEGMPFDQVEVYPTIKSLVKAIKKTFTTNDDLLNALADSVTLRYTPANGQLRSVASRLAQTRDGAIMAATTATEVNRAQRALAGIPIDGATNSNA